MDRGAWWATVYGVAKSRTRLSDFTHSKCSFRFLYNILWKNLNEVFGQPSIMTVTQRDILTYQM